MSVSDRGPISGRKSPRKDGDGSDLSLSGSQVSLISRPRSVTGKASIRALSVSGARPRRPMSAVPSLSYVEGGKTKRRPYSAESQPLLSHSHQRLNRVTAHFSISSDLVRQTANSPAQDFENDGDMEFSSSTLLSSHLSDQLGNAWMELETKGLYLNHCQPHYHSYSTDNSSDLLCYSDISEEPTRSEKSLGEHIRAMARNDNNSILHTHSYLESKSSSNSVAINSSDKEENLEAANHKQLIKQDDPKKMTTKELHYRMVESGLILNSRSKSSQSIDQAETAIIPQNHEKVVSEGRDQSSKFHFHNKHEKNSKAAWKGESCPELHTIGSDHDASCFSNDEALLNKFWHSPNGLESLLNKEGCSIDEVSFPEEHDVDSLEGDSGCTNSIHLTSSKREIDHISNESVSERDCSWDKKNLIPDVRFQQWVTASNSDNSDPTDGGTSAYFKSSITHLSRIAPISDCTIEEVSGEVESDRNDLLFNNDNIEISNQPECEGKVCDMSKFDDASFDDGMKEAVINGNTSESRKNTYLITSSKISDEAERKENHWKSSLKEQSQRSETQDSDDVQNRPEKRSGATNNKKGDCTSQTPKSAKSTSMEEAPVANSSRKKLCTISSMEPKRKNSDGKSESRFCTERSGHPFTKKKVDSRINTLSKSNGVIRKGGKCSFSQQLEENLPGESQPELASWMSICSDKLESGDSSFFHSFPNPEDQVAGAVSKDTKSGDSPYDEILTILRVLEENEDESSLDKILAKRGNAERTMRPTSAEEAPSSGTTEISQPNSPTSLVSSLSASGNRSVLEKSIPDAVLASALNQSEKVSNKFETSFCESKGLNQTSAQGDLRDLLVFLDAVDQSCTSILGTNPHPLTSVVHAQPSIDPSPELEKLLLMGQSELARETASLRLSLEERNATIKLLRGALREQKENQEKRDTLHTAELDSRISQVKVECEAVVKRHQKFIDQLIADKSSLSERCESLIQDGRRMEEKHAKSISVLEERHKIETQRIKDITAATEKLKRERWVETKTQKIKELTVKGLEPELTRLTAQHEQEVAALRSLHAQELEQQEVRTARRASQQLEALRDQLLQEREDALARERDVLRQRVEKQQLLYEEEGAEQRRRLVTEVRRERDRLAALEARLESQAEERRRALEREAELERERLRRDHADRMSEMQRKQQVETSQLREALKTEKEASMETFQQQQKHVIAQATAEIREQLKRERDREIEIVIERLESEATLSREEKEKAAENRLRRVREQLTSELREVECVLNSVKEKHAEVRAQLQEKEDKLVSVETHNRSLQTQLLETQKIADQLSTERADLKQALRCEIANEMAVLRQQLAEQHSRHQQDLRVLAEQAERERNNHQQELQQLYNRVKLAIAKKEEVVKVAKAKQKVAEEQSAHLQALLEQRRRESILS